MYQLSDYDYDLPENLIAQSPCRDRSESRLLFLNREQQTISHHKFRDLLSILDHGDLLVVNNTKVVPARLFGRKQTGGKIEILILDYAAGMKFLEKKGCFQCECLIRASKRPQKGSVLLLEEDVKAVIEDMNEYTSHIKFLNGERFPEYLQTYGHIPLPPYIKRENESGEEKNDRMSYQTVYASEKGAVAAPTAGLHFTDALLNSLEKKGVKTARITLHVGYGTFVPVRAEDIRDHDIHSEYFEVSEKSAALINRAKAEGRRVIAVGTTCVRTLEYLADENGRVKPSEGQCDLFIYPGYRFKCVDAMITNFHLPKSTLLMLVSAFYSRQEILKAYEEAKASGYRFFSYGDAMLIG